MYIKQWAAALLLGAIVLGTASCAKDEPKKPETSVAIEDLAGTWNLSGGYFLPRDRHRGWYGVQGRRPYLQGFHL